MLGLISSSFIGWLPRAACLAAVLAACPGAGAAQAESPAAYCRQTGTDDTLRPIPPELAPQVNAAFGTRMSPDVAARNTVFRCVDGRVAACTAGANLPCGKANTSRRNEGAAAWCKDHPESDFVPAFATGHDTIYAWACHDGDARIARQVSEVDSRGFIAQFWKQLDK